MNRILSSLFLTIGLCACTESMSPAPSDPAPASPPSQDLGVSQVIPKAGDATTELEQLKRRIGQSEFLNPRREDYGCEDCGEDDSGREDEREEQESDVFKVGAAGSKILYLLNQYRGLQIVSYADGPTAPKLVGRAEGPGGYGKEMYFDEKRSRLIVVDKDSWEWEELDRSESDVVVYDVSDPSQPRLLERISIKGAIADSRIVGDVLYVATRDGDKGEVVSYLLTGARLRIVERKQISLPVSSGSTLNIQQVGESYYLLATLSEGGWGWWGNASLIEVIDISDPQGRIHPLMQASAKGSVRERTQTRIQDGTLIVTSNYRPEDSQPARIAVETFLLPTDSSEVLSEREAEYRKAHIERELQGKTGQEYDEAYERLIADPRLGLRGRFVRGELTLRKPIADSQVTVGDTTGLSASLRDVRYQDGLLYAFWVPANMIDPFDVFDISNPRQGVRHISRLQFEGWIERAIPMSHAGRRFVVGLGWIRDADQERGRQEPQAMVFEILEQDGKLAAVERAQFSFSGQGIWASLDDEDKMMEIRERGDGTGEILFGVMKDKGTSYVSGGQILGFDLRAVVDGRPGDALKAGAFLNAGRAWTRRVFTNPEIDRINTFSDRALATFGPASEATELHPIHILELARGIVAYTTMAEGSSLKGVQIIDNSYWADDESEIELRLVDAAKADAEKSAVQATVALPGGYVDHLIEKTTGDLLVLTLKYRSVDDRNYSYVMVTRLTRLALEGGRFVNKGELEWVSRRENDRTPDRRLEASLDKSLVQAANGMVFAQTDSIIQVVELGRGLSASPLALQNCNETGRDNIRVRIFGERLYLASSDVIQSQQFPGAEFERSWLAPLTISGAGGTCGTSVNIPGVAKLVASSGEILTHDESVSRIKYDERYKYWDIESDFSFDGLDSENGSARLVEREEIDERYLSDLHAVSDRSFVRITQKENRRPRLQTLRLTTEGRIEKSSVSIPTRLENVSLAHVAVTDRNYGVLKSDTKFQFIAWREGEEPELLEVRPYDESLQPSLSTETVEVPNAWSATFHFTPELGSFEISAGLSGTKQVLL